MASDIVLYGNTPATSPYVMSVFVALEEKKLPFSLELLDLTKGEQHQPEFVAHSVTNRVPTLRHGEEWISESLAIIEYLEESFPAPQYPRLLPANLGERARARMVMGAIRSDFMPIREERSTETIFFGAPIQPLSDRAEAARIRLVRIATAVLGGRQSIGQSFGIADVDLATMLQRLVHSGDLVPEPLADYARAVWRRPSVRKWLALTKYPG
jgi:glutathione S-transferase